MELLIIFLMAFTTGFIGWLIGRRKGRGLAGFWWSFFLGVIGWIIAACLEPSDEVRRERMVRDAQFMREMGK